MVARGFNVRRSGPIPGGALKRKLFEIYWLLPTLVGVVGLVGVVMIYAATDGVWRFGAFQHLTRIAFGGLVMVAVAMIDIRIWYRRWLDLGITRLQPSELMKPAIVLALARYYHDLPANKVSHILGLLGALILLAMPMSLIFRQPDLGTTLLIISG